MSGFAGTIYALDLAIATGFAVGHPNTIPRSGTVVLKKPSEDRAVALANLLSFLSREWKEDRPGLVAVEAPMHLGAWAKIGNSEANVRMQYGLHGIVEAMCVRFGIPRVEEYAQTIRKHFMGTPGRGERKATKAAVVNRCHLLGYFPRSCKDDNRADACAVFDWAAASLAKSPPRVLHLFGEAA